MSSSSDTQLRAGSHEDSQLSSPPARIGYLDLLRGIAVLGILWMNAVAFGMGDLAYHRLDWQGWSWPSDKVVGILARVVFDQKMMGLFSLLFGASIVLFIERVSTRTAHPVRLSLWRNTILLIMGAIHIMFWQGDILVIYALCSPFVLLLRKLPNTALYLLAASVFVSAAVYALMLQAHLTATDVSDLGMLWVNEDAPVTGAVAGWALVDGVGRALAIMLIGVGMYRSGVLSGAMPCEWYRRWGLIGLAVGVPLTCANLALQFSTGFSPSIALTSFALNSLATVPITLGIAFLVIRWAHPARARSGQPFRNRLEAVGRMALTNYLTQTMLGLIVLQTLGDMTQLHRTHVALFVLAVWALQLWWSPRWLSRFTMGPVEWVWRLATYRRRPPFRRPAMAPVSKL